MWFSEFSSFTWFWKSSLCDHPISFSPTFSHLMLTLLSLTHSNRGLRLFIFSEFILRILYTFYSPKPMKALKPFWTFSLLSMYGCITLKTYIFYSYRFDGSKNSSFSWSEWFVGLSVASWKLGRKRIIITAIITDRSCTIPCRVLISSLFHFSPPILLMLQYLSYFDPSKQNCTDTSRIFSAGANSNPQFPVHLLSSLWTLLLFSIGLFLIEDKKYSDSTTVLFSSSLYRIKFFLTILYRFMTIIMI